MNKIQNYEKDLFQSKIKEKELFSIHDKTKDNDVKIVVLSAEVERLSGMLSGHLRDNDELRRKMFTL